MKPRDAGQTKYSNASHASQTSREGLRPVGLAPPPSIFNQRPKGHPDGIKDARKSLEKNNLTTIVVVGIWPNGPWKLVLSGLDPNKTVNEYASKLKGFFRDKAIGVAGLCVNGEGKAQQIVDAVNAAYPASELILESPEQLQAALEREAKELGLTFWTWPDLVAKWEGVAEIKSRDGMRK